MWDLKANLTKGAVVAWFFVVLFNVLNFMPGPYHWHDLFLGIMSAQYAFWLLVGVLGSLATWFLVFKTDFYAWADDDKLANFFGEEKSP